MSIVGQDSLKTRRTLKVGAESYDYFSLPDSGFDLSKMPLSMKVFLENLLRHEDGKVVKKADIEAVAGAQLARLGYG